MIFAPPFRVDSSADTEPVSRRLATADSDFSALQAENERLLLITEALWRIVKERLGCDERELVRQITAIDLEDGRLDGRKAATPPEPCPSCNRVLPKNRPRCIFCGQPVAPEPFQR